MTKHVHRPCTEGGDSRQQERERGKKGRRGQPDGQKSTVIKSQAAQQPRHELTMDNKSRERNRETVRDRERKIESERRKRSRSCASR